MRHAAGGRRASGRQTPGNDSSATTPASLRRRQRRSGREEYGKKGSSSTTGSRAQASEVGCPGQPASRACRRRTEAYAADHQAHQRLSCFGAAAAHGAATGLHAFSRGLQRRAELRAKSIRAKLRRRRIWRSDTPTCWTIAIPRPCHVLRQAKLSGEALDDYADYLGAQAAIQAGRERRPIRCSTALPSAIRTASLLRTLRCCSPTRICSSTTRRARWRCWSRWPTRPQAAQSDFRYALGRAYQLAGTPAMRRRSSQHLYLTQPLSFEAAAGSPAVAGDGHSADRSRAQVPRRPALQRQALRRSRRGVPLHREERSEPRAPPTSNALTIYAAVCDFKLKHLSRRDVERLPETTDDTAALKMYMLAELSRNENNPAGHDRAHRGDGASVSPPAAGSKRLSTPAATCICCSMMPKQAIYHYTMLVEMFPEQHLCPFGSLARRVDELPHRATTPRPRG